MRILLRVVALLLLAVSVPPLFAARFRVSANGKPVDRAEVCLFRAGAGPNPLTRFFGSHEVKCTSAAADLVIPPGDWNVFARRGTDLIGDGVELVSAATAPPELRLVPSAILNAAALPQKAALFVWIPRTLSAIPIEGNRIPAETNVIPLLVREGKIVSVAEATSAASGAETAARFSPRREGFVDVVVPVVTATVVEGRSDAPVVVLTDGSATQHRATWPGSLGSGKGALLVFPGIPSGSLTATVSGSRWKSAEAKLQPAASDQIFVLEKPLMAVPTSKLIVHWWTPVDLATRKVEPSECEAPLDPFFGEWSVSDTKTFKATLQECPQAVRGRCVSTQSRELPMDTLRGTVSFEDVPIGKHRVTFAYPRLPELTRTAEVTAKSPTDVDMELRYFSFFGRVTRGGKPLHARLFGTVSDPVSGRYVVVMDGPPGDALPTAVQPCDKSPRYLSVSDPEPVENMAYDIEVPENRIDIDVADKSTGSPIQDAAIKIAALDPKGSERSAHFSMQTGKTDIKGQASIENVLTNRKVLICANHPDYDPSCAEPIVMKDVREKRLRFDLTRSVKREGRIVAGRSFTRGQLVWFTPDGALSEMIREFDNDGSFRYRKPHTAGEVVVFMSAETPLYAFRYPALKEDDVFEVRLPAARVRSFQVKLSDTAREDYAVFTIQIGDLVVPLNALMWHLEPRQLVFSSRVRRGQMFPIADILETGPIKILLLPPALIDGPPLRGDYAYAPESVAFRRMELGERELVLFE